MGLLFSDGFESGDLTGWDTTSASTSSLTVNADSALEGTRGCELTVNTTPEQYAEANSFSGSGTVYRVGCRFNVNDLDIVNNGHNFIFLKLERESTGRQHMEISIRRNDATDSELLQVSMLDDNDAGFFWRDTSNVGSGDHTVEVRVQKASSAIAEDATVEIYLDGALVQTITDKDLFGISFEDVIGSVGVFRVSADITTSGGTGTMYVDSYTFRDDDTVIFASDAGSYVIGTAIDNETNGDTGWITLWRDDTMYLQRWDIPTLTKELEITLGAATLAQVQARSQVAYPFAGSDQTMWVFGNMVTPAYLTGTVHLIQTTGGGASGTWTISPDLSSWDGEDVLDSLHVTPDLDGVETRRFTAIRRRVINPPELWQGLNALTLVSALPFPSGASVEYRGMHIGRNGGIAVGIASIGTGTNRIVSAISPYTSWTDITYDYPSGTVEVLRYL